MVITISPEIAFIAGLQRDVKAIKAGRMAIPDGMTRPQIIGRLRSLICEVRDKAKRG